MPSPKTPALVRTHGGFGGGLCPTTPFDSVTPYATCPTSTAIAPGSETVPFAPMAPEAELDAPIASVNRGATPLNAVRSMPPSDTFCEKVACTAYTTEGSWLGTNPWMLVATKVAIEMLPAVTIGPTW